MDPYLRVRERQRWGDWAQVECSNGWQAWVDGRLLQPMPATRAGAVPTVSAASGQLLGLAGGFLAMVAGFLPWTRGGGASADAFDVPLSGLISLDAVDGPKVGVALIALATAAVLLAVRPVPPPARAAVGALVGLMPLLFGVQIQRLLDRVPPEAGSAGFVDVLGVGVPATLLAGGLVVAGSGIGGRR